MDGILRPVRSVICGTAAGFIEPGIYSYYITYLIDAPRIKQNAARQKEQWLKTVFYSLKPAW
jgi:hypothetical protein